MEHPSEAVKEEIEQVLFETTNISSFFKENAEISLTNAVEKFINKHEGVKVSYTREKDEKWVARGHSFMHESPYQKIFPEVF